MPTNAILRQIESLGFHLHVHRDADDPVLKSLYQRWAELQETAKLCRQFASLLKDRDASSLTA